ncbi:MAG: beta-galactosidase, partial [Clostridiales bacterium]|nr:beta-galactosidase [Clostridiales bacterium]
MELMMKKWYEKLRRYGQTNLTEIDPIDADLACWRDFWRRTDTQAIIVNAGGIVAFYPSKFPMHYRAEKLGERDFFGDFVKAGRDAGLAILARMDINRAIGELYRERPEWFARKKDGSPYIVQGRYQSCLNSGYYKEFIPEVLTEIVDRYHPDGFTDNSWTGIPRTSICYCDNCKRSFRAFAGTDLPEKADYGDPVYRRWISWSYRCRMDNWDLFNRVTRERGGEDCLWLGMVNANFVSGHASFCDLREVAKRSKIMMVDHQGRDGNGFEQNSLNGQLLHQLAGWDVVIPESMANYVRGPLTFRRAAMPPLETQLWMYEGFAGGITPWWHIVGGAQEDRRIFEICEPVMQWHKKHEKYLYDRRPVANVGVLWSQANVEWYGAGRASERLERSWRGLNMALTRAGIPFLPINAEDIAEQTEQIDLLILPELAVVTEGQAEAIEHFVARGGNLFAIGGCVGLLDGDGGARAASRLAEL